MEETIEAYVIKPPLGVSIEDFPLHESLGRTPEGAWSAFLGTALKQSGYESDGFKPMKVKVTIEVLEES